MTDLVYNPRNSDHRAILAAEILSTLDTAEFKRAQDDAETKEWCFERAKGNGIFVRVYTSIVRDDDGLFRVRSEGLDAIRVSALYRDGDKEHGLVRKKRVNRTGVVSEVCDRMLERMREAWLAAKREKCEKCGADKFLSKQGNIVCSAFCWVDKKEQKKDANGKPLCNSCGSATFRSRAGNDVCVHKCWLKRKPGGSRRKRYKRR